MAKATVQRGGNGGTGEPQNHPAASRVLLGQVGLLTEAEAGRLGLTCDKLLTQSQRISPQHRITCKEVNGDLMVGRCGRHLGDQGSR